MKIISALFAFVLITTSSAHADFRKDIYQSANEEILNYYSDSGDWSVTGIKNIDEEETDSSDYFIIKAKVQIQNITTSKLKNETCLVSFMKENYSFYAITCF